MASARGPLFISCLLLCLAGTCYGEILFSSLQNNLFVETSPKAGVLKGGEDSITVTWGLSQNATGLDADYKTITVKLCYAPISQKDRAWRKTKNEMSKDKTCQFKIVAKPYTSGNTTFVYTVQKDVPTATYFVRAYAYNAEGHEVAFGQTNNPKNITTDLFHIEAISGRHLSLDIASICFSAFSVVSLFGFFYVEKRKAKAEQQK